MLNKKIDGTYHEDGKVKGVRSGDEIAECKQLITDPYLYGSDKIKETGKFTWYYYYGSSNTKY